MIHEPEIVHTLYKKLLTLYPRTFKEQLGESMEQTFQDLWNEKQQTKKKLFGFVLWMFLETAVGIFRERLLLNVEGDPMPTMLTNLRLPTIISFLLILPLIIMEIVNRRSFNEGFPIPLFVILWLLPVLFVLTGLPILRTLRHAGHSLLAKHIVLFIKVVFLAFLVWMWFGILIDQMPCFLGIPNCD